MAQFQTKISQKRLKKRENKNYHSISFLHDTLQKIAKKQEKNQKNQKIPLWLHFKPKQAGKIIIPFRSYTTRKRKFSKSIKKLYKIQNIIKDSFLAKIGWRSRRKRENKNYPSVSFLLDAMQKISKKQGKNSKK